MLREQMERVSELIDEAKAHHDGGRMDLYNQTRWRYQQLMKIGFEPTKQEAQERFE